MDEARDYDFVVAPVGDDYRRAVEAASDLASTVGMIVDPGRNREVLLALRPYLVETAQVLEYPGAQSSSSVTRNLYRSCPEVADILTSTASDFFEWAQPTLPGALHFLRSDGSALLTSIEGEDEVWVSLDPTEHEHWVAGGAPALVATSDEPTSLTAWAAWIMPRLATVPSVGRDVPWYLPEGSHSVRVVVDEFLALSDRFGADGIEHGLLLEIPDMTRVAEIDDARFEAGSSGPMVTIVRGDDYLYELDKTHEIEPVESAWGHHADVSVFSDHRSWGTSLWLVRTPAGVVLDLPVTAWWLV